MRSSTWRLEDLRNVTLNLGFVGENLHTRQIFDCKKMFDQYPQASVSMTVTPPEGEPYPGSIERDGDLVIWDVKDSDLVAEGDGEIQLVFTQSPHIARSYNAWTHVCRSQMPTGSVPSGLDDFITNAGNLLEQVEETFPAGGTTGQVLAKKSNTDYDTEWIDQTGGGTGDYEELQNLPQIGGVTLKGNKSLSDLGAASASDLSEKYTKPSGGIPASDIADGVIPDPTSIIDDTAGDGDTNKVWSADKSHELLTEINSKMDEPETEGTAGQVLTTDGNGGRAWTSKPSVPVQDVKINDTSAVDANGVANIPKAVDALGAVRVASNGDYGLQIGSTGLIGIFSADAGNIKVGENVFKPVTPAVQDLSVYYGLSKLAGVDLANETVNVGTYPSTSKIAIQKMLGIYEAPWELIREDTATNATEADVEITVDGDGNAYELTDVYLQVWTPQQETAASIGDYGTVRNYYSDSGFITSQMQTWEQASGASAKYGQVLLKNENGAVINVVTQNNSQYALVNLSSRTNMIANDALVKIGTYTFKKTVIKKVTGTLNYRLYGRRKWN